MAQVGRMPGTARLPDPRDERLPRAPLKVVVFEIRYSSSPNAAKLEAGVDLQMRLGGRQLWRLDPLNKQVVTFAAVAGAAPTQTSESQSGGWRLISEDDSLTFTLTPDNATLEATHYQSWGDFSLKSLTLLQSIVEVLKPEAEVRCALRYINRIDEPHVESPGDWVEWIDPNIVGIVQHPIGSLATAAQQQLTLSVGEGIKATVGHGFFKEALRSHLTYVMDFDVYREGTRRFDLNDILASLNQLHRVSLQLFQTMITPRMYSYLGEPRQ